MRKLFNLTTVASGAALGIIVAGVLALIGGGYANNVVHDQLSPQKIYFPAKGKDLPANLNQFAGQQVDTAKEAKAYANNFIAVHLKAIGAGKTYSQVSAAFLKDPTNQKLAQTRQTLFMGETLRGMLLSAWGWGTVAMIATIGGFVLLGIGLILLTIPVLAAVTERRRVSVAAPKTATPTPAI
jgi:hypothetical protein